MRSFRFYRHFSSVLLLACLLTGCSDSTTSPDEPLPHGSSAFFESDAVNERLGSVSSRNPNPEVSDETRSILINSLNDFSLTLHRAVSSGSPSEGSIASGYSAAVALAFASAATGGSTYSSLVSLLGLEALDEPDIHTALNELALQLESRTNDDLELRTANRLFVRPGLDLQVPFLDIATRDYGAPVTEADFEGAPEEVANAVNGWVSDQTNGFIPSIVEQFPTSTVFALLNAIFLDAAWQDSFEDKAEVAFETLDGSMINVPGFGGRAYLPHVLEEDLTALEIPYGGRALAMLILMPEDLESFEQALNNDLLTGMIEAMTDADLDITLPNWQLGSEIDLMEILQPLGLPSNPWDFERLVNGGTTLEVIAKQKAHIEVDKDGTRAAAVTLLTGATSIPQPLVINKPFVYLLRDRTSGAILFSGRVVEPRP